MKRLLLSALVVGTWFGAQEEGRAQNPANLFAGGQGGALKNVPRATGYLGGAGLGFANALNPAFNNPALNRPGFSSGLNPAFNNPFAWNNVYNASNPFNSFNAFNPYTNPFANPYANPYWNTPPNLANPYLNPYAAYGNPFAANPFAANPFAPNPFAMNPYAMNPFAVNPFVANQLANPISPYSQFGTMQNGLPSPYQATLNAFGVGNVAPWQIPLAAFQTPALWGLNPNASAPIVGLGGGAFAPPPQK